MSNIKIRTRSGSHSYLMRPRPQDDGKFGLWVSERDKFSAYVHADVLDFVKRNGDTAAPHETIGLLAGRICHDPVNGPYALVMAAENAVLGEFESSPGHVKLKAAGQTHLRHRLEVAHPDREIIGWYHTHPSYPPIFSHVDAHEQRTWSDQNSIGIVYSTDGDGAESFGVYRGPNSDRLRSVSGISKKILPPPQPWPFPQPTLTHLTPRPEPLDRNENILVSTPAARLPKIQILIVSIVVIICLAQVFGFYRLDRRLTFTEGRLHQLSMTFPAQERQKQPAPLPSQSPTSETSESSQADGPEMRMPVKPLTPAPQPRRTARSDKNNNTKKAAKKAKPDKPRQPSTSAKATAPAPSKEPAPKATPK